MHALINRLPFTLATHHSLAAYTTVFNVLDYPAAVIPVTRVDPVLDVPAEKHEFRHVEDKVVYEMCEYLAIVSDWEASVHL